MLQHGDIQEKTYFPAFERRPLMLKDPIVPLLSDIPTSKDNHLSKTKAFEPFLCKNHTLLNK
jgi:hypothetical protein